MIETGEIKSKMGSPGILVDRFLPLLTFYRSHETAVLRLAALTICLILWELIPKLGLVDLQLTSSPSRIFRAAHWLLGHGLGIHIWVSIAECGAGFLLAVIAGVPLGLLLGWRRQVRVVFDPFVSVLYATPWVALLPLLFVWLGVGLTSKIALVFLGALFPILINVIAS